MPIKAITPQPKKYPCHIGVHYWFKTNAKGTRRNAIYFKYTDAQTDIEGWTDPKIWLPLPYDLVLLKTEKKIRRGWWDGFEWVSHRIKPSETVLYWKCIDDKQDFTDDETGIV